MSKFNLKLYPEGGYLVCGLSARVAFEIENEQTMRLRLKGELLEDGTKLMDVESGINNRGVFEFKPQRGRKYQLRFALNGSICTKDIEGIKDDGVSIRADMGKDSLKIRVLASSDAVADSYNAEFDDWYKFDNLNYSLVNFESYLESKVIGDAFISNPSYVMPMLDDKYDLPAIKGWYGLSSFDFINKIKKVSIVTDLPRRPAYYMLNYPIATVNTAEASSSLSASGRILGFVYFKKFPEKEERFVEGRYSNIAGFSRPAEYYAPDYSKMPLPEVPDHRHTLYWNPNVTTDKDGKARIEFFNNSSCTEMFISAEGISEDGKVIVY